METLSSLSLDEETFYFLHNLAILILGNRVS